MATKRKTRSKSDASTRKGIALRSRILGKAHVARSMANVDDFNRDFQGMLNKWVWAETWARPGLPLKVRSMLSIALLAATGQAHELKFHIRGALENNGCTPEDIREVLLHTALYAGIPPIVSAFPVAREVIDELGLLKKRPRKRAVK